MRTFNEIANLIKKARTTHPKGLSQAELSKLLGYKNGQFISNVERGLCSIPLKMLARVGEILHLSDEQLKQAILNDYAAMIDAQFANRACE